MIDSDASTTTVTTTTTTNTNWYSSQTSSDVKRKSTLSLEKNILSCTTTSRPIATLTVPSSSTFIIPASPTTPQSQFNSSSSSSSSLSTTAFLTPISSSSQRPSRPPSPTELLLLSRPGSRPSSSSTTTTSSTLTAALAALHFNQNNNNNNNNNNPMVDSSSSSSSPVIRPLSIRPAPPSPIAISRRQSTKSTTGISSLSRPLSGIVLLFPEQQVDKLESMTGDCDGGGVVREDLDQSISQQQQQQQQQQSLNRPAIIIRDYAFESTDDRYHGLGPFVPKWNKLERLTRVLVDAARDDEEAREKRRKRKERKEMRKYKKEEKKKERKMMRKMMRMKKESVNGWSESESDSDDDDDEESLDYYKGHDDDWTSSESGSSDDDDESEDADADGDQDYHHHQDYHQDDQDTQDVQEGYYYNDPADDYSEDIPIGPLLPGLYRALYPFEPEGEAEMGLEEGQVVRVVGRGGGVGWAVVVDEREGRSSFGLGGHALVPESYLQAVRLDLEDD